MGKYRMVKSGEVEIESLIKRNFSEEFMRKIYDIYIDDCMSIVEKTIRFDKLFTEEFGGRKDYRRIGEGTNRFVCLLDNHIIKVAYNYLAYIDNMNELAMAKKNPAELARAYETNGLILVSEYVTVMDKEDFLENQFSIQCILTHLQNEIVTFGNKDKANYYILGDMGVSNKNYGNWGRRMNGEIVVLDYGYLYEMNYSVWKDIAICPICNSSLEYANDYTELKCKGDNCKGVVKYTTLRNNLGYSEIIKNIKMNLNNDKYVKFDSNGKITVDIMEKEYIEETKKEEFVLPEEYQLKLDMSMSRFFDLSTYIKRKGFLSVGTKMNIKEELYNERDLYDEVLFPMLLGVIELYEKDIDVFLSDFNKKYNDRYNSLYSDLQKINEIKDIKDDLDSLDDLYEDPESEGFEVHSNISFIDKLSNEEDVSKSITSLDDILTAEIGNSFDLFMADENEDLIDKLDDKSDFSLDEILIMLSNEKVEKEKEEEQQVEEENIEELLQERYDNIISSFSNVLSNIAEDFGDIDYIEGDVYHTYLNGDYIDWEYSPLVNAKNVFGGWHPDEFAFPLYRHLLPMFNYDSEDVNEEYEARYRIDEDVVYPEDIYDKLDNRNIVIDQILNRFETNKPRKHVIINSIGRELDLYYEALDKYYENMTAESREVGPEDPKYYYEVAKTNTSLMKEMDEARENLEDDLADDGIRLRDMLDEYKLAYYYDTEYLFNSTQEELSNIIKRLNCIDMDGNIRYDIKDMIINEYFKNTRMIIDDNELECFIYGQSYVLDIGNDLYKRTRKPTLKAKLVPKDSNEDIYKPLIFNKDYYTRLIIEQRYETVFKNDGDEKQDLITIISMLNDRNLYYSKTSTHAYNVKTSKDNLRYLLTEKEIELLNQYQDMYGFTKIKDVNKTYAKAIIELILSDNIVSNETIKFLNDLAKEGLSKALAERSFRINVLELSGTMTRLDYLNRI